MDQIVKIFQIGFNKSATRSISVFFRRNGFTTADWARGELALSIEASVQNGSKPLAEWSDVNIFTDMEKISRDRIVEGYKYFRELHAAYPDSKFILNTRNVEAWIRSRDNHGDGAYTKTYLRHLNLETKEQVFDYWRRDWFSHHLNVLNYFSGGNRDRLFIWDIENPDFEALNSFIGQELKRRAWMQVGKTTVAKNKTNISSLQPKDVEKIRTHFRKNVNEIREHIRTDELYDIVKIYNMFDAFGIDYDPVKYVNITNIGIQQKIVYDAMRFILPSVSNKDHYIFNRADRNIDSLRYFRLKDVFLSFDIRSHGNAEFYFFTGSGALINGLFLGSQPFLEKPLDDIEEPVAFIDDCFPQFNICHLLFDKVPRAEIARRFGGTESFVLFYGGDYTQFIGELIEQKVISIADTTRRGTIRLRDCVCFSNSFGNVFHPAMSGGKYHLDALRKIRSLAQDYAPHAESNDRIFVDRVGSKWRHIANLAEIKTILLGNGFTIVDPGSMPVREQLALFAKSKVLAGVHGAGLANLAFQPAGATVLELLPPLCATPAYWIMSNLLDLNYRHLVCEDSEFGPVDAMQVAHNSWNNRRDVVVPVAWLQEALAQLP